LQKKKKKNSGGGFDSGASSDPKIDGSYLAAQGIVFASYNYRLSLFGFPHAAEISAVPGATQNLGLLDTRAAVQWLAQNVARFGGDPRKIVLGGESVGAGGCLNLRVHCHMWTAGC
jgi:carboxylesterase type B